MLLDNIISIKNRDENLRELLKLPSINDDIRELGVGGGTDSLKNLNDLNYLLPSEFDLNLISLFKPLFIFTHTLAAKGLYVVLFYFTQLL